jgi:hypothetical protein
MSANKTRLRFDRVEIRQESPDLCAVDVTFTFSGRQVNATATRSNAGNGPLMAAATATIQAIEQAVNGRFTCVLEDLDRVNALGKDLIAVLVDVNFDGRQFQLFGSCQITGDEVGASVKATLNATNRFVELATRG